MSYTCSIHGWQHLLNFCPRCQEFTTEVDKIYKEIIENLKLQGIPKYIVTEDKYTKLISNLKNIIENERDYSCHNCHHCAPCGYGVQQIVSSLKSLLDEE